MYTQSHAEETRNDRRVGRSSLPVKTFDRFRSQSEEPYSGAQDELYRHGVCSARVEHKLLQPLNLEVLLQCQRHCPRVVFSVPVLCCHSLHLLPLPHDATCAAASLHVAIFIHERPIALNEALQGCTPQARYAAAGPLVPLPGRYETVISRDI